MSRSVRIRGDIAAQVEAVAVADRRPFANAVEVLLLAALTERENSEAGPSDPVASRRAGISLGRVASATTEAVGDTSRSVSPADVAATIPGVTVGTESVKRGCGFDTPKGTKCKLCGKVH